MSPSLCSLFFAFSFLQAGWMDGVVFYVSDLDTEFTLGDAKQSELFTDLITRTDSDDNDDAAVAAPA